MNSDDIAREAAELGRRKDEGRRKAAYEWLREKANEGNPWAKIIEDELDAYRNALDNQRIDIGTAYSQGAMDAQRAERQSYINGLN